MPKAPSKVAFSHFGFYVRNLEQMRDFYCRVLGFVETDRGVARGRPIVFLSRDPKEHHQVVLVEGRTGGLDDLVINQISLRVGSLADLRTLYALIKREKAVGETYTTDHGTAWSVYFRDPENNRVELFVDSPWYVEQPRVDPLDLDASDAEIMARTRAAIEKHPSFRPIEVWQREFAAKLTKKMEEAAR
ncbi:MAG: VOC family protein [Alphaproteobacteria bacterium]